MSHPKNFKKKKNWGIIKDSFLDWGCEDNLIFHQHKFFIALLS